MWTAIYVNNLHAVLSKFHSKKSWFQAAAQFLMTVYHVYKMVLLSEGQAAHTKKK